MSPDVLRYGELPDQVIDVWPSTEAAAPVVVVIHGGFWRAEWDVTHAYPMCAALAADGHTVAAIEYRRVGQDGGGWPGTFDDVALAVDRIPELLGGQPVLVGHSAGGHLALWAAGRHRLPPAARWHRPERPAVRGVVSLAGVCDLSRAARRDGSAAALLLGASADQRAERLAVTDPMRLVGGGTPAILLHGDADDLVKVALSRDYATAAEAAGDPVQLRVLAGQGHFELIDPGSAAWPAVAAAVAELAR